MQSPDPSLLNPNPMGARIGDLDTPALLLDRAASDRNIGRMASFFQGRRCKLRPHFKNHKCPALARRQIEAGNCVGMTCAKLGEAEVLASHGFRDVLVANQIVGPRKVARLVELARHIRITVAVDDAEQALAISKAASAAHVTIGVFVEVDIGMGRCGVAPGRPALDLASAVLKMPGLRFDGLQAYEGHAVYINDTERRAELVRRALTEATETRKMLETHGIAVAVVSGGSSSTYTIAGQLDGIDEIQAGTYPTMDWRYAELSPEFEIALSVLSRVISRRADSVVLDVGSKGLGCEFGPPKIVGHAEVEGPSILAEEHCVIRKAPPSWRIGDLVRILPSHACTTCNLYRRIYVCEDDRVVDIWPIEGSGRLD